MLNLELSFIAHVHLQGLHQEHRPISASGGSLCKYKVAKVEEAPRDQAITIARTRLDKANQVADATMDTAYAQANVTVRYAKSTADALLDKYRSYKTR